MKSNDTILQKIKKDRGGNNLLLVNRKDIKLYNSIIVYYALFNFAKAAVAVS